MAAGTTNKGTAVQICVTPQPADLNAAAFAALTYVDVCCATEVPTVGSESEIISEFCISGVEKTAIGASTGATFDISVFAEMNCVGQDILRQAYGTQTVYAMRIVRPDGVPGVTTASAIYTRVMVSSAMFGGGGINDMVSDVYTAKITQEPIFVKPAAV
jgi:hypothetical protein